MDVSELTEFFGEDFFLVCNIHKDKFDVLLYFLICCIEKY